MDGGLDIGGGNDSQFVGIRKGGSYCKTHIIILGEMQPPLFEGRWGIFFFWQKEEWLLENCRRNEIITSSRSPNMTGIRVAISEVLEILLMRYF